MLQEGKRLTIDQNKTTFEIHEEHHSKKKIELQSPSTVLNESGTEGRPNSSGGSQERQASGNVREEVEKRSLSKDLLSSRLPEKTYKTGEDRRD